MAKKLVLLMLLSVFQLTSRQISATNTLKLSNNPVHKIDLCDAPAPENFQAAGIENGNVNLSWEPAWAGATHTLEVFHEDGSGGWANIYTLDNVPGSTYTLPELTLGSYRATIATNCSSGEASSKNAPIEFKIIDLLTGGRIPLNPVEVNACEGINMNNYHWVGFRVSKLGTPISTLFEITLSGEVKRVGTTNQIVATNKFGVFPIPPGLPSVLTLSPFRLVDRDPALKVEIGYLDFVQPNWNFPIVRLCVNNDPVQWKAEYRFTALTANATVNYSSGFGIDPSQGIDKSIIPESIKAENPIKNTITLFIPQKFIDSSQAFLEVINEKGQLVSEYKFTLESNQVNYPAERLSPGIYFLKAKTTTETIILKVVKPE